MNKKLIYFLMNQVILTMDYKKYLLVLFIFFYTSTTFSEIIYNKNNLIITNIDLNNYKQIYKNNYDLKDKFKFVHGKNYKLPNNIILLSCYHPSPINVNTGRINEKKMKSLFKKSKNKLIL